MSMRTGHEERPRRSVGPGAQPIDIEYGNGRSILAALGPTTLFTEDALGAALLDYAEALAKGAVIENPGGWIMRAAKRHMWRARKVHLMEAEAMGLYLKGGMTDAFGQQTTVGMSGEEYREYIRNQARAAARKRRARKRREREEGSA